ncbi:aprataxin and PNK-like factor isoform X2 [Conger conger]|uniref:aprataxin and PNK-like factor isoform X2 n=1 Tax=Conger conger TaxID=82655 RepID=UPI002A5AE744|nr:aprataxin and PNK-like factor isoform X2 [Conger conger]
MSGFELESVDGGTSIPLPEGETPLGRGPFLGVSDKRVSRHHGLLDITDGQLRIKPTHQNPCFYQPSLGDPPEPLENGRWHDLRPGNVFSLLPGKYVYRVVSVNVEGTQSNSQVLEEDEPPADVAPGPAKAKEEQLRSPELNGQSGPTPNNSQTLQAESTAARPPEKEQDGKMEENTVTKGQEQGRRELALTPEPVQKKRVLPAWMLQGALEVSSPSTSTADRKRGRGGKAPPPAATKPRPQKARNRPVSSEEEEEEEEEPAPKRRVRRLRSEEEEEEEEEEVVQSSSMERAASGAETRPPGGAGVGQSEEPSGTGEGRRNAGPAPEGRPALRRRGAGETGGGGAGGRQNQRAGAGQDVGSAAGGEAAAGGAGPSRPKTRAPPRAPCPYGKTCYRKNPVHFQECSHPGNSDYAEGEDDEEEEGEEDDERPECPYGTACYRKNPLHRKEYKHTQNPGKRAGPDEEEEGEEEDWDDDSFINDDSGDEGSDYVPPESEDEDVQRLKKEAQAFLRKKR